MQSVFLSRWSLVIVPLGLALVAGCDGGGGGGGGTVSGDEFVESTNPAAGATGVAADAVITITFDRAAVPDTEDGGVFVNGTEVDVDGAWSEGNTVLTVTPAAPWEEGTTYTVTITALSFADGSRLGAPYSFTFTVGSGGGKCETDADCGANEECSDAGQCVPKQPGGAGVWEQAGFGAAGNFIGVYYDSNQSGVAYACSDVAGVYRSTDGGHTWEIRSVGLGNYQVASLAVDPFDSDTLYAGGGAFVQSDKAGIYVSRDAGLTWAHLESTFDNGISFRRFRTADAIAPDPSEQGVILTGSRENGIWRTTDGGQSWTQVHLPDQTSASLPSPEGGYLISDPEQAPFVPAVSVVVFDPSNSDVVYAGLLGGGVVKSTDGGVSWALASTGLPSSAVVEGLAVGSDDVVYAAAAFDGMYKSTDGGAAWQAVNGGLPLVDADGAGWRTSVAVHPTNPDIAYMTLASGVGVGKTTDGGTTWVVSENPENIITYDSVNDPTRVWSAGFTSTWQVKIDPFNSDRLLAVSFWTIQRSDDAGATWADSIAGAQNTCVTQVHFDAEDDTLYATHWDAGLMASTDRGASWTAVLPAGPEDYGTLGGHYWRFAVARVGETKYYYMTADPWDPVDTSQVMQSTDGVNWTSVFQTPRQVGSFLGGMLGLAVDPSDPSTVYVSQDGGQVFKTTDSGQTWTPTAAQLSDNSFTYALTVDEAGRVFVGALNGGGLSRSTDGGGSWQQVLTSQGTVNDCLAVAGAVYACAGDANLYRSTDGGDTWEALTSFASVDDGDEVGDAGWTVAVDPADPNHILFTRQEGWHTADDGAGVDESFDGGVTWHSLNTGLGLPNVSSLVFGPDGTIYAGTSCGGIWRLPAR